MAIRTGRSVLVCVTAGFVMLALQGPAHAMGRSGAQAKTADADTPATRHLSARGSLAKAPDLSAQREIENLRKEADALKKQVALLKDRASVD